MSRDATKIIENWRFKANDKTKLDIINSKELYTSHDIISALLERGDMDGDS